MRELKPRIDGSTSTLPGRTPPGVRELKQLHDAGGDTRHSRTPPGVRELKLKLPILHTLLQLVAPFPGCVN